MSRVFVSIKYIRVPGLDLHDTDLVPKVVGVFTSETDAEAASEAAEREQDVAYAEEQEATYHA